MKIFSHIKYFLGGNVLESLNLFINPKFDINTYSKGHMAPLIQNHGMFLSHIYTYTVSKNKSSYFIIKFFFWYVLGWWFLIFPINLHIVNDWSSWCWLPSNVLKLNFKYFYTFYHCTTYTRILHQKYKRILWKVNFIF